MTISTETRKAGPLSCNGATVAFPFAFKVFATSDVLVVLTDSAGTETTLTLTTHYSVSLNADQDASPGGTVTTVATYATGNTITIGSDVPYTQAVNLTNNGGFYPDVINAAFDKLTILIQQLFEKVDRSLKLAISTPAGVNTDLPAPEAYKVLAWNAAEDGLENTDLSGTTAIAADLAGYGVSEGAAMIGFKSGYTGSVGRTLLSRLNDTISVKDFGATGDGVADDTAEIQAALDYANSLSGAQVYFPRGTYLTGKLTIYSGTYLLGDGRNNTTIKLKDGADTDLIYGYLADTLWGGATTTGLTSWGIRNLTLDGNRANNAAGSCIAVYGQEFFLENLWVKNAEEYGIRTEWGSSGLSEFGLEGQAVNVRIDTTGKHGWFYKGPHDSVFENLTIIDAGQATTNTWDGLYLESPANGRFIGCHFWTRGSSNRMRYAVNIESGGGNEFTASHFEGAYSANVRIAAQSNIFDDSCRFYAPWNGVNILLLANLNVIKGTLGGPVGGQPACKGIVIGDGTHSPSNCLIDVAGALQEDGFIDFTYDGGANRVCVRGYNVGATNLVAAPSITTEAQINITGSTYTAVDTKFVSAGGGFTATGTVQGDALALNSLLSVVSFTTVAAGTGTKLSTPRAGKETLVQNLGANTLNVYPGSGHQLADLAVNAPTTIATGKSALFKAVSDAAWMVIHGA
jgi:hypothetical protein